MRRPTVLPGRFFCRLVRVGDRPIGWYAYVARPGGASRVLHLGATERHVELVLSDLVDHAREQGSVALAGRAEPHLQSALHVRLPAIRVCPPADDSREGSGAGALAGDERVARLPARRRPILDLGWLPGSGDRARAERGADTSARREVDPRAGAGGRSSRSSSPTDAPRTEPATSPARRVRRSSRTPAAHPGRAQRRARASPSGCRPALRRALRMPPGYVRGMPPGVGAGGARRGRQRRRLVARATRRRGNVRSPRRCGPASASETHACGENRSGAKAGGTSRACRSAAGGRRRCGRSVAGTSASSGTRTTSSITVCASRAGASSSTRRSGRSTSRAASPAPSRASSGITAGSRPAC